MTRLRVGSRISGNALFGAWRSSGEGAFFRAVVPPHFPPGHAAALACAGVLAMGCGETFLRPNVPMTGRYRAGALGRTMWTGFQGGDHEFGGIAVAARSCPGGLCEGRFGASFFRFVVHPDFHRDLPLLFPSPGVTAGQLPRLKSALQIYAV